MIPIKDLRIGDLVKTTTRNPILEKGSICKVVLIDALINSIIVQKSNIDVCRCLVKEEVEGVPLTPEILEKNGFEMREDTIVYAKNRLSLKPLDDEKGYQVGLGSLRFFYVKVKIVKYVHEFQHILWALGEDANLKI